MRISFIGVIRNLYAVVRKYLSERTRPIELNDRVLRPFFDFAFDVWRCEVFSKNLAVGDPVGILSTVVNSAPELLLYLS